MNQEQHNLLRAIANASATNSKLYVNNDDNTRFLAHPDRSLIRVDTGDANPDNASQRAAHITDSGLAALQAANGGQSVQEHTKPVAKYAIINAAIELPKTQRGFQKGQSGNGAPSKYPFDDLVLGGSFFVPDSDVKGGNALKTVSSAAGSANQRYARGTGNFQTVSRAQRGKDHKAIKGPDGKNIMHDVQVEEKVYDRKFLVRAVIGGQKYGEWIAPENGALVQRVAPDAPGA